MCLVSKVGVFAFQVPTLTVLEDSGQAEVVIQNTGDPAVSATLR